MDCFEAPLKRPSARSNTQCGSYDTAWLKVSNRVDVPGMECYGLPSSKRLRGTAVIRWETKNKVEKTLKKFGDFCIKTGVS